MSAVVADVREGSVYGSPCLESKFGIGSTLPVAP